jgi:hypothetical protein
MPIQQYSEGDRIALDKFKRTINSNNANVIDTSITLSKEYNMWGIDVYDPMGINIIDTWYFKDRTAAEEAVSYVEAIR